MKIAVLVQDFTPEVGAGPARIQEMARVWIEEGAEVTVVTGMPNRRLPGRTDGVVHPDYRGKLFDEEEIEGIRVLRSWVFTSPKGGMARTVLNNGSFMVTSVLNGFLRLDAPDVLVASSPPFLAHPAGWAVARAKGIPLVLDVRDLWPDYLKEFGILPSGLPERVLFGLEEGLLKSASRVVTVTGSFQERVIEKGVEPERTLVVPNGVDLERYFPDEEADFPFEYDTAHKDEIVAGYLGTFGRGQGLEAIVRASADLEDEGRNIRVLLVGDGSQREAILDEIESTGATNVDVRPPVHRKETQAIYNACDVCLVPLAPVRAFEDTIPSKLFEIMACGRPVIASAWGEAARIVHESGCGSTCPPGDAEALAEALRCFADLSEPEREKRGRRGREHVERNFDRRMLARRYWKELEALMCGETRTGERALDEAVS